MNMKKITAIISAFALAIGLCGAFPVNAQTTTWREAYLSVIKQWSEAENPDIVIEKIDDNNIPELFIACESDDGSRGAIYSFSEDGLTTICEFSGEVYFRGCNKAEGTIVLNHYSYDPFTFKSEIIRIDEGKPTELFHFGYYYSDEYDYTEYNYNGKLCDRDTYLKSCDKEEYYRADRLHPVSYDDATALLTASTSGKYEGFSWKISSDGVLTITGEGEMPVFMYSGYGVGGGDISELRFYEGKEPPWYKARNLVEKVVLDEKITEVSNLAFANFDYLTEIKLHEGIVRIGDRAFMDCENLVEVSLPSTLTVISPGAFSYCDNLRGIVIPENVENINYGAFEEVSKLEYITILNKDCNIVQNGSTISNYYDSTLVDDSGFRGTIVGYPGSTAQAYAEAYGRNFASPLFGDANYDGDINAVDSSLILSDYANTATGKAHLLSSPQRMLSDINSDSAIDAIDASILLAYYAYMATGGTASLEDYIK